MQTTHIIYILLTISIISLTSAIIRSSEEVIPSNKQRFSIFLAATAQKTVLSLLVKSIFPSKNNEFFIEGVSCLSASICRYFHTYTVEISQKEFKQNRKWQLYLFKADVIKYLLREGIIHALPSPLSAITSLHQSRPTLARYIDSTYRWSIRCLLIYLFDYIDYRYSGWKPIPHLPGMIVPII